MEACGKKKSMKTHQSPFLESTNILLVMFYENLNKIYWHLNT